ncbi:thiol-disulfide isomerase/thioredoxin [Mesonia hippocampi]|uniref:Thiol-disulfide isomerase/thioredoxin n=1 Tax=Mesonia hippocampi TaxID=1628250 RepID=A0A840ENZ6_9FLAO|nr:TlpA disulfide reductase family protein [Mesonia hippocampi]MBB4119858.1 thiol-disulfide isomerase/thioredoxin [Mesonia hippocampi]
MKKVTLLIIGLLLITASNAQEVPTQFSDKALNDTFISTEGDKVKFKEILAEHQGNKILIDVWASWCKDCIVGMPKLRMLQEKFPEVSYVFLSLDKNKESWKKALDKYKLKGDHYYMKSGWKGKFGNFLQLNWIPRYLLIGEKGEILWFNAIEADDPNLIKALQ